MNDLELELSKRIALFRTTRIKNMDLKFAHSSDFSVLMAIYNSKEKISAIEISKYLGFSKVYASKVLKHLLDNKLIYREQNDNDKRQLFLYLTEKGRKLTEEQINKYIATTNYLLNQFGEEKAKTFIDMLKEATKILYEYSE
ncbi:MAG: MarR family transcriptional regulator [Bacilli bacterium]|nr:MarR family transcriptional regulator [Bacilli bacterium]